MSARLPDHEIVAAVRGLRAARAYPATLAAVSRRLRLGADGRRRLEERLLAGDVPAGLSVVRRGKRGTVLLTLTGEEDVDRPLRKAERVDLRLRLADLERSAAPAPADIEAALDAAYARLARESRSPFVALPALRAALAGRDRASVDRTLVALCEADRYQLSEHEHPSRLPEADRDAALVLGGRAYWFVSRV